MPRSPYLVRARTLTGFAELVRECGGDPAALLASEGLTQAVVETPEASIPLHVLTNLLSRAAESLDVPDFGVRMAGYQDITILGAIALIALNSETVGQALDGIGRGMPYHSPALQSRFFRVGSRGYARVIHDIALAESPRRQLTEYTFLNAVAFMRAIAQLRGADWEVQFEHRPGFSTEKYAAAFGCKVSFEQPEDVLIFPAHVLDAPVRAANPELRSAAERYVRSVMRRHPLDIARQVEDLVLRQLTSGRCSLPVVAGQLATSPKTLQRRLMEQGVCFEDIVDNVRRQRTEELLPVCTLPLQRIADSLGYSSQSSFTRSCRRWFGESPLTIRAKFAAEPRYSSAR